MDCKNYNHRVELSKNIKLNYLEIDMGFYYDHKIDLSNSTELTYLNLSMINYKHPIDLSKTVICEPKKLKI